MPLPNATATATAASASLLPTVPAASAKPTARARFAALSAVHSFADQEGICELLLLLDCKQHTQTSRLILLPHSPTDSCRFTSVAEDGDNKAVVTTPAQTTLLGTAGSVNTYQVKCATPTYTSQTIVGATFTAAFAVLEGGEPLPWDSKAQAPSITFKSAGPVVSGISDKTLYLSTIQSYPDGNLSLLFTVSDADSDISQLNLTFDSSNKAMVPLETIAAIGSTSIRTLHLTPSQTWLLQHAQSGNGLSG